MNETMEDAVNAHVIDHLARGPVEHRPLMDAAREVDAALAEARKDAERLAAVVRMADRLARSTLALNRVVYALGDGPHLEAINVLGEVEMSALKHGQYVEARNAAHEAKGDA